MSFDPRQSAWLPIAMLTVSNIFMTFAWYGHLKFKGAPLMVAVLASWGIAFFEYLIMVPANRWGNTTYSTTELKIIQEVVTLTVFSAFVVLYMGEKLRWNHIAAFVCILAAVAFTFLPKQ
ncbi:MAG TPA: DMT family protein [Verrucomicrobiae bacterium]|nr:DMT family protein [Verrucomicrobiae bacterium]